jgi:hypothetical protein
MIYFRKIQSIISIILFTLISFFAFYTTGFNILEIQLSYLGIDNNVATYWNFGLIIVSISLFFNVDYYINNHNRIINKPFIRTLFISAFTSLFLTGLINMHYKIHDLTAFYYFFSLPLIIYIMAFLNRKKIQYKEWLGHLIFSTCMIVFPLSLIHFFKGMAISEIVHSIIVFLWGIWILKQNK